MLPQLSAAIEEQRLKAVIIYKLSLFVSWPADDEELNICTFSKHDFNTIKETIGSQTRKGKSIHLNLVTMNDNIVGQCDILNLDNVPKKQISKILESIKKHPILTVGDGDSFARNGGIIGLFLEDEKVKFSINFKASRLAELKINSNLLKLAVAVY